MQVVINGGEVKEEPWQTFGVCRDYPSEMFWLARAGDPITMEPDPLTDLEIAELNEDNFNKALSLCALCPVRAECEASVTEEDSLWTVRAGRLPVMYRPPRKRATSKGVAPKIPNSERAAKKMPCLKGHEPNWFFKTGYWRCYDCVRVQDREDKRKRREREQVLTPKKPRVYELKERCKRGHNDWMADGPTRRRCRTCCNERRRNKRLPMPDKVHPWR